MTRQRLGTLLRRLRPLVVYGAAGELGDADLLRRFVERRDAAAFEVLVWRHGPMVYGVCRRMLRREQDAEDAFQATFLTLVRKARSVARGQAVGAWLYRVASRIAAKARAAEARRPQSVPLDGDIAAAATDFDASDLRPVLDAEIGRLPTLYRIAFILCYLQGKTNAEAARELRCPPGTVATRLAWARRRLRTRLTKRGWGAFSVLAPALPGHLIPTTVRAGIAAGRGTVLSGAVSARAALWSRRLSRAMFMTKVKIAAAVCLVGLVGVGAASLGLPAQGNGRAAAAPAAGEAQDKPPLAKDVPAAPPAHPDKDADRLGTARKELADEEQEWEVLEEKLTEERSQARCRLLKDQTALAHAEQDAAAAREEYRQASVEIRKVELSGAEAPERLKNIFNNARGAHNAAEALVEPAKRALIMEEEWFRSLERRHAFRREVVRARLEDLREKVREAGGVAPHADAGTDRRFQELERKLDALTQSVGELRRDLRKPAEPGDKPKPPTALGLPRDDP
jgi:RNA polymerase sigma factor (sigma-70 family)